MDIQLNYINQSNDSSLSSVFFYQKNYSPDIKVTELAWKVIEKCGRDDNHPFTLPTEVGVNVVDSYGNHTPIASTQPGEKLALLSKPSGHRLVHVGQATSSAEIQVVNGLDQSAIAVTAYKNEYPIVTKTGVAPKQMALFQFTTILFAGVASQIALRQPINSLVMSCEPTELDLLGVASADIVLRGGGTGPSSRPFRFCLQNVLLS